MSPHSSAKSRQRPLPERQVSDQRLPHVVHLRLQHAAPPAAMLISEPHHQHMTSARIIFTTLHNPETGQIEQQRRTVRHARGLSCWMPQHQSVWEATSPTAHNDALTIHHEEPG